MQADSLLAMMDSAGKVLFFATSSKLLSRFRFVSPRSDLLRHHCDLDLRNLMDLLPCPGSALPGGGAVFTPVGEQRPNDSSNLVGLRNHGDIPVL